MINVNSPIVQQMLSNTPSGSIGNISQYYGNTPTVQSFEYQQSQTPYPYPSPMEMAQQQQYYNPYQYYPYPQQSYGYNHPCFQGYYNPYMGIGSYGGIPQQSQYSYDERIYEEAKINGVGYYEQVQIERDFYKSLSMICSASLGKTKEEAIEAAKVYDEPLIKQDQNQVYEDPYSYATTRVVPPKEINIIQGDKVVKTNKYRKRNKNYANFDYRINNVIIMDQQSRMMNDRRRIKNNWLHEHAIEREMDNCSLIEFFNDHAWKLTVEQERRELISHKNRASELYNRNLFQKRLEMDRARFNVGRSENIVNRHLNRYVSTEDPRMVSSDGNLIRGKNGIMPDGTPVSPDVDPAIAESFTIDQSTGKIHIDMPPFMKEKLGIPLSEQDKRFINSENKFVESLDRIKT